jgi:hypothetical protein
MRRILPILLLAFAIAACGDDDAGSPSDVGAETPPFFLSATLTVDATGHVQLEGELRRSEFRWWFQDTEHSRSEIEVFEPAIEAGVSTWISRDGETISYSSDSSEARRLEIPFVGFPSFSLMIGPSFTSSVAEFVARWDSLDLDVVVSESREFLGREVVVVAVLTESGQSTDAVEVAPNADGSPSELPSEFDDSFSDSQEETGEQSGLRIWLEPSTGFVWRSEIAGPGEGGAVEIVELKFDPEFEEGLFDLTLPEGVSLVEREQASGSSTQLVPVGDRASFNAPFLSSRESSPIGGFRSMGESHENGQVTQAEALFTSGESEILISQRFRRDGVPPVLREGEPILIGDAAGYELEDGDRRTLAWAVDVGERDDLVIVIEAVNVDREELLAFAASFE